MIPAVLPILTLGAAASAISASSRPEAVPCRRRSALLSASVVCGVLVTVSTEIAGLARRFDAETIGWVWAWAALAAGTWAWRRRGGRLLPRLCRPPLSPYLLASAALAAAVAATAWVAPPNNYDSMVYHMSRVLHWVQNRSAGVFPTPYLHEVWTPPWAEYAIAHLQLLTGSDRLAGFVQWSSMVGCASGVSLVAARLGGSTRAQIMAAVVCVTIPMGILQGSSTQNDYVAAYWLVCLTAFVIEAAAGRTGRRTTLEIGGSLGLALLTKGTAYLYAPILLAVFGAALVRRSGWRAVKTLSAALAVAALLNAGYFYRNYDLSRVSIVPPTSGIMVREYRPELVISNAVRNMALHLASPFEAANRALESGIAALHRTLGVDPSDARVTSRAPTVGGFRLSTRVTHEDFAGNPVHFWLAIWACLAVVSGARPRRRANLMAYAGGCVAAVCLALVLVKWNPYNSRYHLPIFVLCAPLVSVSLCEWAPRRAASAVAWGLLASSVYWVACNELKPWTGPRSIFLSDRFEMYFRNRPDLHEPSVRAAEYVRALSFRNVGLRVVTDHWEYPFWVLLTGPDGRRPRIEHVGVDQNRTRTLTDRSPYREFEPEAVLQIDDGRSEEIRLGASRYVRRFVSGPVSVYVAETPSG